jgi:hypothetical protein
VVEGAISYVEEGCSMYGIDPVDLLIKMVGDTSTILGVDEWVL